MNKNKPVTVMTECPRGSNQKFDYDPEANQIRLSKILPLGLSFPFDFGMIPGTKGEDGDPLDVVIISEGTTFPGCLVDCRIIGALKVEQTERNGDSMRNDRFFGIPEVSQLFKDVHDIKQLPKDIVVQVEAFFRNYNEQAGKEFKVQAYLSAVEAAKLIK